MFLRYFVHFFYYYRIKCWEKQEKYVPKVPFKIIQVLCMESEK